MKILAPVTSCDKVLCIGMNYKDHCEEQNAPVPVEPVIFNKFPSCIIGPNDDLSYPKESKVRNRAGQIQMICATNKDSDHFNQCHQGLTLNSYGSFSLISCLSCFHGKKVTSQESQ